MTMHIIFFAPVFPVIQYKYLKALKNTQVHITGMGEEPPRHIPPHIKACLDDYEQVHSMNDDQGVIAAVKRVQSRHPISQLIATYELQILTAARTRQACSIPGLSVEQALICRDKTRMKEFMRENNIPCAASIAASTVQEIVDFGKQIGYPLIIKPRAGAGSMDTWRIDNEAELQQVAQFEAVRQASSLAVEEFIEGHEATYDTLTVKGQIVCDFVTHYFPNPLVAMKNRDIAPYCIATNRLDSAPAYDELREMGRRVNTALGLDSAPTHMEWFFNDKGLKFSEIAVRPPGADMWDLYCVSNEIDLYQEWAWAMLHGRCSDQIKHLSRKYAAAILSLRPNRNGIIQGYKGLDEIERKYKEWIFEYHFPTPGTPTQSIEISDKANAWLKMRHPDYDTLCQMLEDVGRTVQVFAG